MPRLLDGRRILIVEDEYLAALELRRIVEERGGTVVGPVARVAQALALIAAEKLDGAILDVRLNGEDSCAVADALSALGVPFVVATGYAAGFLPERLAALPRLAKPVTRRSAEKVFRKVFGGG